jgi:hypothetical protein
MGKIKKIEISEEVIEFYRGQTAGMSRGEAMYYIEQAQAGEIDFSHNKRIKRCPQCDYWFEDGRANKRKCCSAKCKNRYDTAKRKGKRQEATAEERGITVDELQAKREKSKYKVIPVGDASKVDYYAYNNNDGNSRKVTMEFDESGEGKANVMVYYGERKIDREPGEVEVTECTREGIDKYLLEKYGAHRLKMERARAKSYGKRIHFAI